MSLSAPPLNINPNPTPYIMEPYDHQATRAALNAHASRRTLLRFSSRQAEEVKGYIARRDLAPVASLLCQYWAHEHGSKDPCADGAPLFNVFVNWAASQPLLTHKDARRYFFDQLTLSPALPEENPTGSEDWTEGQDWARLSIGYVY